MIRVAVKLLDAHLGNDTGRITATMAAPLLLTSFLVRYEALLHGYGTSSVFVVVYILATSKVTPGQVPICDSAHSW